MQISFVMIIFLLFLDQISGGAKVSEGANRLREAPPAPLPTVEESHKAEETKL